VSDMARALVCTHVHVSVKSSHSVCSERLYGNNKHDWKIFVFFMFLKILESTDKIQVCHYSYIVEDTNREIKHM
jgi:hypothetical protein